MHTRIPLVLALVSLGTLVVAQGQDPPDLQLKAAVYKETVEGDLQGAVALYRQIVSNPATPRPVAAAALLRWGGCHEKLGQQDARRLYERLIVEYADQTEEAAAARQRLAALQASSNPLAPKPAFRQVTMPARLDAPASLSPDGKRIAFTASGSVWTVPLKGQAEPNVTGIPTRLTEPMGARLEVAWSGDGGWLAFNARDGIFVVRSSGGTPRKVLENQRQTGHVFLYRLSLSRDGSRLAYTAGASPDTSTVRVVQVDGGPGVALSVQGADMPAFAPDDQRIALVTGAGGGGGDGRRGGSVWIAPAGGGGAVRAAEFQGPVQGPVWSPDGSLVGVLETEVTQGAAKQVLRIVRVPAGGKTDVEPARFELPLSGEAFTAAWTADNAIALSTLRAENEAIYTVPATGGRAAQISPKGGSAAHPRWSRDGKTILLRWGYGDIASVPSEGGEVAVIPVDRAVMRVEAVPGGGNAVSPDGKTIVFSGGSREGNSWTTNIWTVPVTGGQPRRITHNTDPDTRFPCWSPDGKSIAFVARSEPMKGVQTTGVPTFDIYSIDVEGGEARKLTSAGHRVAWASVAWSPDGKEIAYFTVDKRLAATPATGGEPRTVASLVDPVEGASGGPGDLSQLEIAWSPTGDRLAYAFGGSLWTVGRSGGRVSPVATGLSNVRPTKLDWSPDGRTIAFTGYEGGDYEIWLVEKLGEALKARR